MNLDQVIECTEARVNGSKAVLECLDPNDPAASYMRGELKALEETLELLKQVKE